MMIQITDQTINHIAQDLIDNYIEQYDDEPPVNIDQMNAAVENWLLRTIHEIEQEPAFYAPGTLQSMNSRVPEFKEYHELQCCWFSFGPCRSRPEPHQIYCAEHLELMREEGEEEAPAP